MSTYTILSDFSRLVHTGSDLSQVTERARLTPGQTVIVVEDATGRYTEVDDSSTAEEVCAFFGADPPGVRGRGRPRLGVVRGEVTLLPRHWAWLKAQRGGASATLRRLVDEARKGQVHRERARQAADAAAKVMGLCAGDQPGFEEAMRHLYAGRFDQAVAELEAWPHDLRAYVTRLFREAEHCALLAAQEAAGAGQG